MFVRMMGTDVVHHANPHAPQPLGQYEPTLAFIAAGGQCLLPASRGAVARIGSDWRRPAYWAL
jgi:hypothetical protein